MLNSEENMKFDKLVMSRLGKKCLKLLYQGSRDGFDAKVFH